MIPLAQKCFFPVLALMLIAAGCSRPTVLVPPSIHYGSETCADCGMIIAEPHYAAALVWHTATDDSLQSANFDDIGCLLNWRRHHAKAQIVAAWVKDIRTANWLEAASACYVKNERLTTPMGSGIVAGAVEPNFTALSVRQPTLTWTDLLNLKEPAVDEPTLAGHNGGSD